MALSLKFMKSRQKTTRVQLKVSTDEEYSLLGIVSAEPDYKLSLSLNRELKISLRNTTPIGIKAKTGVLLNFSKFSDVNGAPDITYNLISNKSDKDFLLKKLDKIDYLFQIHSPEKIYDTEQLTSFLRGLESVTAVFNLNPCEIKDKNMHYIIP
jgi:hypothetical protein